VRVPWRRRPSDGPVRLCLVLNAALVGGAEVVLLEMFRHLDPEKVRPELVCLREGGTLADDFRASGFDVTVFGRYGWKDLRQTAQLWRHFRRTRPDVVLVPHFQRAPLVIGPWFAKLSGVPANVIAVHNMDLHHVGDRALPSYVVETLPITDGLALLVPSQSAYLRDHEGVGRYPWRRVPEYVVPNGIRIPELPTPAQRAEARAELGFGEDDVVAVIVARITDIKGHDLLLRALARLAPEHPRLRVLVVGEGPLAEQRRALAAELGVADRVVFTGLRRDVPRLLAASDLGVLPSKHEGVPMSVIEQMAAGLPVVASAVGGLPDIVRDGEEGHLVPAGDLDALTRRLGELAGDDGLRHAFGKAARLRAERDFSIETTARCCERMISDLLGR
jgi:glycosyltransferase involved in cell wall biosynthesis